MGKEDEDEEDYEDPADYESENSLKDKKLRNTFFLIGVIGCIIFLILILLTLAFIGSPWYVTAPFAVITLAVIAFVIYRNREYFEDEFYVLENGKISGI